MKLKNLLAAVLVTLPLWGTSCNDDSNTVDYGKYYTWRDQNNAFMSQLASSTETYGDKAYFAGKVVSAEYPAQCNYYHVLKSANLDSLKQIKKDYAPLFTSKLKVHYTLYDTKSVMEKLDGKNLASLNDASFMNSVFFDGSNKADTLESKQVTFFENFTCADVVTGWGDLLQQMHIGDSWLVAIPWRLGYAESGSGSTIDPFTNLFFRIELCDITEWGNSVKQ